MRPRIKPRSGQPIKQCIWVCKMWAVFVTILRRDLSLAIGQWFALTNHLVFFLIVVSLFPLGIGTDHQVLAYMAPGIIWVAALLASLLALDQLFVDDYRDGTLEQMMLIPQPFSVIVLAKVLAHWMTTGLPLVLISPLSALQYQLKPQQIVVMMVVLLLGTPVFSVVGAIGAALTLGVRMSGILPILILPLTIPVVVYGAGAIAASGTGQASLAAYYMLLGAFLLFAVSLGIWAIASSLQMAIE